MDILQQRNSYNLGREEEKGKNRYRKFIKVPNSEGEIIEIAEQPFLKMMRDNKIVITELFPTLTSIMIVYESVKGGVKGVMEFKGIGRTSDGKRL